MSEAETRAESDEDDATLGRQVRVMRYPGCDPVTFRTTRLNGEEPNREERMRSGLRRLAQEGRIPLPH